LSVVLPDVGVQKQLENGAATTNGVLGAQIALGELAAIWQEQPSVVPARGVAVSLTPTLPLAPEFWGAFAKRIAAAPFLHPLTAAALVSAEPAPTGPSRLTAPAPPSFTHAYAVEIKQQKRRVVAYRA